MAPETPGSIQRWRNSPWLAHLCPLVCFLALQSLVSPLLAEGAANPPWWRLHPEHLIYPLQTIVCAVLLAFWWRRYEFAPLRPVQVLGALLFAATGIAFWIAPVALGWTERTEGFDPYALGSAPLVSGSVLVCRFLRLAVITPLVEEIFWRGFLQRYLVDTREDFWITPLGTFTWFSSFWTTVGVVFVHQAADWPAAAVWGILVAILYVRTRSLSACVLMHSTANLILGVYVLRTEAWGLW